MLTPEEFKTRMLWRFWDRAVLGWDRVVLGWIVQCSWISWISPAPLAIFNKLCEILDYWIYEIYVDLLIAE